MGEFHIRDLEPMTPEQRADWFKKLTGEDAIALWNHWPAWTVEGQDAPERADWPLWLVMAGRGFGKTRMGAQWVWERALSAPDLRIAIVGATMAEARAVMVEGESGLLSVTPIGMARPSWEPSKALLRWANGAQATLYSGENPESLRGPQHHFAWCDELAKWAHADDLWHNLQLGLRLGDRPQALVTTTPRAIPLMRALIRRAQTRGVLSTGHMRENRFLPADFVAEMAEAYGGTRFGRQELEGALIEDFAGALWTRAALEACRVARVPPLRRVVVGVDPPAGTNGDACGIVAVGKGEDGHAYVLEDASVSGLSPEGWARAVAACVARVEADKVIAEANNGGRMVETVLRGAAQAMPVKLVHALRGKVARAEPVQALYGSGRAFHAGAFPALEDELCGLIAGGDYHGPGRSPDRADALVWAMTELMLGEVRAGPRVRVL